jgi:hypothetical protein
MKRPVPTKQLLGTIIEFPQPDGLDTLTAFVDGRVRYINHTGHLAIEGAPPEIVAKANELMRLRRRLENPSRRPRRVRQRGK